MNESQFKNGDIVYHKANNLRMVVLSVKDDQAHCKYVDIYGKFAFEWYLNIEISIAPIPNKGYSDVKVIYSLPLRESKSQ